MICQVVAQGASALQLCLGPRQPPVYLRTHTCAHADCTRCPKFQGRTPTCHVQLPVAVVQQATGDDSWLCPWETHWPVGGTRKVAIEQNTASKMRSASASHSQQVSGRSRAKTSAAQVAGAQLQTQMRKAACQANLTLGCLVMGLILSSTDISWQALANTQVPQWRESVV